MKKIKCLLVYLCISIMILSFTYLTISIAVEGENLTLGQSTNVTETVGAPDGKCSKVYNRAAGVGVIGKKTVLKFSPSYPGYDDFNLFPIDHEELDKSPDRFCGEHNVEYGGDLGDSVLEWDGHGDSTYTLTKQKFGTSKTSNPKGDIDTSAKIYCDASGNLNRSNEPSNMYSHRSYDDTIEDVVKTNWVYVDEHRKFTCEKDVYTNAPWSDGAMAFLLACYKSPRGCYRTEPLQHAIWYWLNGDSSGGTELMPAAKTYDDYHEKSANPNVDCVPADNVGTTLVGSNYHVGPFTMSRYIRAQDFAVGSSFTTNNDEYVGDMDSSYDNVSDDGTGISVTFGDGTATYNYGANNLQAIFDSHGGLKGTIIKAKAVLNDGTEVEFPVPEPGATFYVDIPISSAAGADELTSIVFTYQRVHASGNGTLWVGHQLIVSYVERDPKACNDCTYYCQEALDGCDECSYEDPGESDKPFNSDSPRNSGDGCDHHEYYDCYDTEESETYTDDDGSEHTDTWTEHHSGDDYVTTYYTPFLCWHGYEDCWKAYWKYNGYDDQCQDAFAGAGALVPEQVNYIIKVEVPLKTVMKIYKYIEKADHTEGGSSFPSSGDDAYPTEGTTPELRREMTMAEKDADAVPVERGDWVTYHIELTNDSRFDTQVKVKDTLPTDCEVISIPAEIENSDWITVPHGDKVEYEIEVRPTKDTGKDTNTIEYITTNTASEHMRYVHWGDGATHGPHEYGNIVNTDGNNGVTNLKEKDSDTYVIKEYNVGIDKYIVRSDHTGEEDNSDTYGNGSEKMDRQKNAESSKEGDPIPVERGDKVTYYIDVYNTREDSVDEDGAATGIERLEPPYYNPDLVYVDIEDTLPPDVDYDSISFYDESGSELTSDVYGGLSTSNSKVTINSLLVPKDGMTRIKLSVINKNYDDGGSPEKYENNAAIVGDIRNINYTSDRDEDDKFCVAKDNDGPRKDSSDWHFIKRYNVNIDKYIYDVQHDPRYAEPSEIDTTIPESEERTKNSIVGNSDTSKAEEGIKHENPVYVEYGDTIIYRIDVYNTTAEYDSSVNRDGSPYWNPNKVYVNLEDTLPTIVGDNYTVEILQEDRLGTIEKEDTKFTINDLMVPPNDKTTIQVTVILDNHEKGTVEENNIKFIDEIRNINYRPSRDQEDEYCVIKNHPIKDSSSDWIKINNYNTFVDKYVEKYNELIMFQNNDAEYTDEDSLTNEEGILLESRENTEKQYGEFSDDKYTDKIVQYDSEDGEYIKKKNYPLGVEQNETIVYNIKIKNEAQDHENEVLEETAGKPATQIIPTEVTDKMQVGLKFESVEGKLYNADGTVCDRYGGDVPVTAVPSGQVTEEGITYNVYKFNMTNEYAVINPGEYIIIQVTATIEQSNMYLYLLENSAKLTVLRNINDNAERYERIIRNDEYNENISEQQESKEFVRMKDLVISGKVWLDYNKDGLLNDSEITAEMKKWYNINEGANNGEKQDIPVRLYRIVNGEGELYRITKTDANGLFTFGRDQLLNYYTSEYNYDGEVGNHKYDGSLTYQRIPKCDPTRFKDTYGRYVDGAVYQEYYIEYEYDGVIYKSTFEYANQTNLNTDNGDLANDNYKIDSNAYEFVDIRDEFNTKYEYISYNIAYDSNKANPATLVFDKEGHTSELIEDNTRAMKARSFIKEKTLEESVDNTDLLWLYKQPEPGDKFIPYTEHLKYINLGLELREDVDIALVKDVYKVKTTVNGDEMEYSYNQVDGVNGDMSTSGYLNNYIINKPYGLEVYNEDYTYRVDQYFAKAVKDYKTEDTELNVEVTYRLSIHNRPTKDDERVEIGRGRDTKLDVKISEIMDLYDENFIKYNDNPDETINVKVNGERDVNGETQLVDKPLKIAEAWYFTTGGDGEKYRLSTNSNGDTGESIYEPDPAGTYTKKLLTLSNTSLYSQRDDIQARANAQGYNALYITGMEDILIPEGEKLDIYIKYVVDKDKLEVINENKRFDEHINPTDTTLTFSSDGVHFSYAWETTGGGTSQHAYLERSLKLIERKATDNGDLERFLEGIGQVNMYSVWYANDDSNGIFKGHEASLVDRDSNAGNLALGDIDAQSLNGVPQYISPTTPEEAMTDVDNVASYDDTAYKTGVDVFSRILKETETYTPYHDEGEGEGEIPPPPPIRKISGKVWDDTRSEMVGGNDGETFEERIDELQYVGNGKYDENDHVITQTENGEDKILPKINDNVPLNYHNTSARSTNNALLDETTDILVRNAKVELVEIVPIKVGDEYHYYEEVKGNQIADIVQNFRTNDKGEYELRGFAPGKYIVRYTYGDTVDPNIRNYWSTIGEVQDDMVVFNGQDYKSTQYNSVLDSITDPDEIILGLEQPNVSDARDDEIRRLDVISYSEVMNNRIAEVLKGSANRAPVSATEMSLADTVRNRLRQAIGNSSDLLRYGLLSPQTPAFEGEELTNMYNELTDNTYMQAETVEFTVRTEKLTEGQIPAYDERKVMTIDYNNIAASDIEQYYKDFKDMLINHIAARDYSIENIDFGIEYRPEAEISLVKEVSEVKILTASRVDKTNEDNVLIDLKFLTREPTDGDKVVHYIDEVNSKGLELLQFISNAYAENHILENLVIANEDRQGLIYIQVDDSVLQGSTIEITYRFYAENDSEIDRISPHLNEIRYRNNVATKDLQSEYNEDVTMTVVSGALTEGPIASPDYRASGTGANAMRREFYRMDGNSYPYRNSRKMMEASVAGSQLDFSDGYYGKYLGAVYYKAAGQEEVPNIAATGGDTGRLVNVKDGYKGYDVVAPLKFTKVIDYVDTGLEYVQDTSVTDDLLNRNWYRVTEDQLKDYVFEIREQAKNNVPDAELRLLDPDGLRYKPVVTIDDRQQDPVNGDFSNETPKVTNFSLSRFLLPDITIEQNHTRTDGAPKYPHYEDKFDMINGSTAEFYIPVSKVIASETDTEDMVYENLAEVIEFITLTGRRTNFAATIGNASIQDTVRKYTSAQIRELGSPEFFTAALEADQASVETITLTPPTGLQRFNRPSIISPDNPVQTSINITLIVAAVAILGIGGSKIATTLYAKRRIK